MAWPKGRPRSAETIAKLTKPRASVEDRYWAKVERRGASECWPWLASKRGDGYGQMGVPWGNRTDVAHRIGWFLAHGLLAAGTIDHVCHNIDPTCPGGPCAHRACQNPAHWRLTTRGENVLAGKGFGATNRDKTHCEHGHAFDVANTYIRPDGWRDCRKCRAARETRGREAKR
jgi:hypothetical protein